MIGRLLQRQCAQRLAHAATSTPTQSSAGSAFHRGSSQPQRTVMSMSTSSSSSSTEGATKVAEKVGKSGAGRRRKPRARKSASNAGSVLALGGVIGCGVGAAYFYSSSGGAEGVESTDVQAEDAVGGSVYNPAKEGAGTFAGFVHGIMDRFRGGQQENDGKLLPDYENSVFYEEGQPPPLTLVVDLEETLGTSTWDRKHGWRFVKRPGLDYFLHQMARCGYEVVIFSTNPSVGAVEDTLALLDPMGQCVPYKLFVNSAAFKDGRYVKDFTNLNRDMSRVVIVDDNMKDIISHRENCIAVKPFDDIEVTEDETLGLLAAYLQTLAAKFSQGLAKDVRTELRRFQSGDEPDEPDFLTNFSGFLEKAQVEREKARERGLGAKLRKTNFLKQQQQQPQQQPAPAGPVPGMPGGMYQLPTAGMGTGAGAVPGLGGAMVAAGGAAKSVVRYRKTIWERMTDPENASKQDKEMQDREKQWQAYAKQLQGRQR